MIEDCTHAMKMRAVWTTTEVTTVNVAADLGEMAGRAKVVLFASVNSLTNFIQNRVHFLVFRVKSSLVSLCR